MLSDTFFTPSELATELVSRSADRDHTLIADFAAGAGQLLVAAEQRWPEATFVATDLDQKRVDQLRRLRPRWQVGSCDFLKARSRRSCLAIKEAKGKVTLAILNPPFSCRGGSRWPASMNGSELRCSRALAFLVEAANLLAPEGEILAVLPAGSLTSQKDRPAWTVIRQSFKCDAFRRNGREAFEDCSPRTVLVHLARRARPILSRRQKTSDATSQSGIEEIGVVRGVVPMHTVGRCRAKLAVPLIHTTDLVDNLIVTGRHRIAGARSVRAPAVLLPRVGQPDRRKIALYTGGGRAALSDCVIGVECCSRSAAERLQEALLENWGRLRGLYGGTCAQYITISSLTDLLLRLGFRERKGS